MTELRVHGVGGTSPEAILGDFAPEQVWDHGLAGFYRSADHKPAAEFPADVGRHVEAYSWGGLTGRSRSRVLWLALLPFLLGNVAGWMCSARTRGSRWRFALHRAASSLGALALTVNAALLIVLITADLLGYQAVRSGRAKNQWWLAPLGWPYVKGYPARQVSLGIGVAALALLALVIVARRSWRYEEVRPPFKQCPPGQRTITAAALRGGLAHDRFWDGERSVRVFTWLHLAAFTAFLALVTCVLARSLGGGSSARAAALCLVAAGLAGVVLAGTVAYLVLDALTETGTADEPRVGPDAHAGRRTARKRGETGPSWSLRAVETMGRRHVPAAIFALAGAALAAAVLFGWLQPQAGLPAGAGAAPPGIAPLVGWTALAIAVPVALLLLSVVLGLDRDWSKTLVGGPWVTLVLGFSVLNIVLLGAQVWIGHILGPLTTDAKQALDGHQFYLPYLTAYGAPLAAWAAIIACAAFAVVEWIRWLRARRLPPRPVLDRYDKEAGQHRAELPGDARIWLRSVTAPDPMNRDWSRRMARARMVGGATGDAGWLLWGIVLVQFAAVLCGWQLHWIPPLPVRNAGIAITLLFLPVLMGYLYSTWNDQARRRSIARLWEVTGFWPRAYHPLAPPCYTEQAVPDLQRRIWWLHDNGGRVLLVAHSQGAVLAVAALAQRGHRPAGGVVGLVTFGSPVERLYAWAFPAYFPADLLYSLAANGGGRLVAWRNFYYRTDPIGGPMPAGLVSGDGGPGHGAAGGAAGSEPVNAEWTVPGEGEPDPAESWYVYGTRAPAPRGHSGYWTDRHVWDEVNKLAARLSAVPGRPR